jgi:hypothetical protein
VRSIGNALLRNGEAGSDNALARRCEVRRWQSYVGQSNGKVEQGLVSHRRSVVMSGAAKARLGEALYWRGAVTPCCASAKLRNVEQWQRRGWAYWLTPAPSHIPHVAALLLRMPRCRGLGGIFRLVKFVEHLLGRTCLVGIAGIIAAHLKKLALLG